MKGKSYISKHILSIIVVIVVIFIGISVNLVRGISEDAIIESTLDELERIGVQNQTLMENKLQEVELDLSLLAESIAANNIDSERVVEYLNTQSQVDKFQSLYYISLDGNGVSAKGEVYDFSENESFQNAVKSELHLSDPKQSHQASEIVFELAMPIKKNEETTAALFCEIPVLLFLNAISENQDYEGDVFFVDTDLNMFFSTSNNHVGDATIPEQDVKEMGEDNVSKAQRNIINKQNGGFYYDYLGTPKVMVYYPIANTNVALAMNVQVEALSSEITEAFNYFDLVGIVIYWTAIALVLYISFTQARTNKRILKVAYYDTLTELPNLAKLKLDMSEVLENNRQKPYSILVIDIDNFKAINEMFGYDMGDRVLKTTKIFSDSLKEPSLITARIGDDKFALFAGNGIFDDLSDFVAKVSTVFDVEIPELADYAGTFKIGRYKIELGETNVEDIMSKVNLAHARVRSLKGEMLCDYDDEFKQQVITEADIYNKMNIALANHEFKVFLQPKFSAKNDRLVGAEALVRWIGADGTIIYPNNFIPLFERNGFIVEIDRYVLEQVCIMIRRWTDEELGNITVSVNCSRLNLSNPFFVDGIVAIADKYGVPHNCIEIELTESTTISSEGTIEQLFDDLHKNGFKISIDDFGAGYSSLGMLKNLHIDTLKMDRSFFIGGKGTKRDDMLIDSIIKMAHNLGMYVVAEGIEAMEQVELLKDLRCDAIQGYVHAKPMPVTEFEETYNKQMYESITV